MTESAISMFKREDEKLAESLQYIVPVYRGGTEYGPAMYEHPGEPEAWEKANYAKLLTGKDITPTLTITNEDIDIMKEKAYKGVEMDFNNYVGSLLEPNKNPANKAFLQKIYPGWFDKQKKAIENWHETKKKIENILILGPRSEDDLFLLYRLGYKPGSGVGTAVNHRMGWFEPLINQIRPGVEPPGLGAGYPKDKEGNVDETKNMANFQRGIFNIDRRELYAKSLYGYPRSIFPGGVGSGVTAAPNTFRDLPADVAPMGPGFPKPLMWTDRSVNNDMFARIQAASSAGAQA